MKHRHLRYHPGTPVERLPSAALVDLLDRGDLGQWHPLRDALAKDPHGPLANRVLDLLGAFPMYGTSALWRTWIDRRRTQAEACDPTVPPMKPAPALSLATLRRRLGLTQAELARRMDMSQSDLSKLERRRDIRLSSLRLYAQALGGRLETSVLCGPERIDISPGTPPAPVSSRGRG